MGKIEKRNQLAFKRIGIPMQSKIRVIIRYLFAALYHFFIHFSSRPGGSLAIRNSRLDAIKDKVDVFKSGELEQVRGGQGYANYLNEVVKEYQTSTKELFEIPLATMASLGERHAVSLVIDKDNKKIYVLDTKGYSPSQLKLESVVVGKSASQSVQKFIDDLSKELQFTSEWEEQVTSFIQKPRDCIFTVEALVRALAKQGKKSRNLSQVQQNMHDNYRREVDAVRAHFFK